MNNAKVLSSLATMKREIANLEKELGAKQYDFRPEKWTSISLKGTLYYVQEWTSADKTQHRLYVRTDNGQEVGHISMASGQWGYVLPPFVNLTATDILAAYVAVDVTF